MFDRLKSLFGRDRDEEERDHKDVHVERGEKDLAAEAQHYANVHHGNVGGGNVGGFGGS
jgi:hypothetical protein